MVLPHPSARLFDGALDPGTAGAVRALGLGLGLNGVELGRIEADLRARGLEGCPAYEAWLRTEIVKRAQRKAALRSAAGAWTATTGPASQAYLQLAS